MPPAYPFPTPLPVLAGTYLIRAYGSNTLSNTPVVNQFAFRSLSPAPLPSAAAVGAAFATRWMTFVASQLNAAYHSQQIGVYDLSTSTSVEIFSPAIQVGGQVGTAAPPNITARLIFPTAARRKHGGTHISPISETIIAADRTQITGAAQTALEAAATTMLGGFALDPVWPGSVAQQVLVSIITNKLYAPQAIPVLRVDTAINLGSQRRRRGF